MFALKYGSRDFPGSPAVKNPPFNAADRVRSLVEEVRSHIPQSNYTLAATRESVRGTENVLSATTKTNAAKRRNKSQQKSQLKLLSLSLRGDQVFVPLKKGKKKTWNMEAVIY